MRVGGKSGTARGNRRGHRGMTWMSTVPGFLSVSRHPGKVLVYALASLGLGLSIGLANGFIVAAEHESVEPFPELDIFGFGGNTLVFALLVAMVVYVLFCLADGYAMRGSKSAQTGELVRSVLGSTPKLMFLMLLAWLPVIIVLYPGVVYHDTEFQLIQFFGSESLDVYSGAPNPDVPKITDHHPILTTLAFSFFAWIGTFLGGGYNGLFLFVILQSFLLAASLSFMVRFLYATLQVNARLCIVGFLFCALFPLFPIYASSISKDAIFAPFFVLLSTLFCWIMFSRGRVLHDKRIVVLLAVASLGFVLTKKLGIYVLLICLAAALFYCREKRTTLVASAAVSALTVFVVVPVVVFPLVGGGPGSSREMFSVPFAQTALYVKDYPQDVTESEHEIINEILGFDSLADRYAPETADFVKGSANIEGRVLDYVKVYLAEGLRHPLTYLRAFMALEAGFVGTMDGFSPLTVSVAIVGLDTEPLPEIYYKPSLTQWPAYYLGEALSLAPSVPVLGMLFSKSIYSFLAPCFVVLILLFHDRRRLLQVLPYLVFTALLFLSPISTEYNSGRYVFPLVCTFPLLLGVMEQGLRTKSAP